MPKKVQNQGCHGKGSDKQQISQSRRLTQGATASKSSGMQKHAYEGGGLAFQISIQNHGGIEKPKSVHGPKDHAQ
jgi:hypothetical protein